MHGYHVPTEIRLRCYSILAILSIVSALLVHEIISRKNIIVPWWIDAPSVMGFLGLFSGIYDQWWWKKWPFGRYEFLMIPNISGHWQLSQKTSHQGFGSSITANCLVRQTSSNISISIEYPESHSNSRSAAFLRREQLSSYELEYRYISYPKPSAPPKMEMHQGVAWLKISDDCTQMEGEYFTGRGRQNYGSLHFDHHI